ncbi:LysE family translocator [Vibrio aquaticus]|uniref:LysE family translocator n=1 Tax=Vibrio aquaticus TaxID=2496559 RepID=A0A432D103_9VIBR|nr:LysE family translocator [Vibrio aquaticus]RTZ17622.1 LysE family translocator [Vibrio aquaticus]
MDSVFVAMVIFAFVGAVTPGPVNLIATSTAAQFGKSTAAQHVLGASIAYALVVFITGNTLNSLVEWLPRVELAMQFVGSVFLCYLAFKIYSAPFGQLEVESDRHSSWMSGALVQLLNPKAWLVAMSGVSLYVIGQSEQHVWLWMYTLVSLIACLLGVGLWALVGSLFTEQLREPRKQRFFNRTMATILLASVLMIWV